MLSVRGDIKKYKRQLYHIRTVLNAQLSYYLPFLKPARHVLVLTNLCNLRCQHCYQSRGIYPEAMTANDWMKVVSQLPKRSSVTLTGGEPLMFKGFFEIFNEIADRHSCNIITNGTLLNHNNIELFLNKKNFRVMGVSIDGKKELMKALRGMKDIVFEKMIDSLKYFVKLKKEKRASCILNIKTVILDENIDSLFDFHCYVAEEIKADTHDLYFLKGSPIQHSDTPFRLEDCYKEAAPPKYYNTNRLMEELQKIFDYDRSNGLQTFLHPKVSLDSINLIIGNKFRPEMFKKCVFPRNSLHINSNGDVYPCLSIPIGNVKRQSLKEVYNSADYKRFLNALYQKGLFPACVRCGWLKPAWNVGRN